MAGYNYAPPPPPPPTAQASYGHYQQHGGAARGGGPAGRGRGGHSAGGRHEYPQYDYSAQQAYGTPAAAYPAAQPHASYQPSPQHWAPQDHRQAHPQPQPHAPAPLSTTNYHPNYAPQHYAQGHPQPPAHQPGYPAAAAPPQPHHTYHYPAAPAPYGGQPSWHGHEQPAHTPQYGGQPRGGYGNDRGGARAPSMGAQGRPEYGSPAIPPQVTGGYAPQQYADPRAPVPSYPPQPPYNYAPAPPPPSHMSQGREPYHKQHDSHHHQGGGGRGRGGFRGGNHQRGKNPNHRGGDRGGPRHGGRGGQRGGGADHGNVQKPDHAHAGSNNNAPGKKKKRKTNTLGLTPGNDSESEDDEKEEETLRTLLGPDALQVSDIASYVAERKKNFPTASRVKARKDAQAANSQGDKRAAALEREEKMAEKLRRQLEKVESSIKRKREQQDEGDEMRDSPVSAGSDDDAPEALSTRAQGPQQAAGKKADVSKHCKYFSTGGTCGKKGKCRFVHDPEVRAAAMKEREANNGQLTIQQRLVLNDKDQEDLTVLQSIQYLREKGMIDPAREENAQATNGSGSSQTLPKQAHGLPAKPPSKRENRPAHEPPPSVLQLAKTSGPVGYKGWNLSGYGNTGLKSEDLP